MYGSSLHAEVFCSDQPSSVKLSLSRFATSFVRSSFARCTVVPLGLQMDSPSQRQPRLANADAPASEIQAFPHMPHKLTTRRQQFSLEGLYKC